MAFMTLALAPAAIPGRVFAATGAKSTGGKVEEKGLLDFIIGALNKKDSMLEVDPLLQGPAEKKDSAIDGGSTGGGRKNTVVVPPPKKSGGFGGLFAKK